jgi:NitT/TauT family transport system permease protein
MATVAEGQVNPAPGPGQLLPRRQSRVSLRQRLRPTRRRVLVNVTRLVLLALVLFAWEYFAGNPGKPHVLINEYYVSKPSAIWQALTSWVDQGVLWSNLWITVEETLLGFLIGAVAGCVIGLVLGVSRLLSDVLFPFITALNSTPRLALVPLFLLWFGLGSQARIVLVVTITFFLVFYATYAGVRDVDEQLLDVLRVLGGRSYQLHAKVTIPSAMVWIISGLRVSVPYALVAAVTAEMIASNQGMGYLLVNASGQFDTAGVFAGIAVLIVLGLVLNVGVSILESVLLRWRPKRQ